ncbi:glycosyl transferase family 28 [Methylobacterium soli]|uniref:Glycosyl transferase family 28 n=1 Tax=Methylobacterium soli TaxID=553447 RepID=A0A6L3SWS7_9HYPH|nr:glycosyl transferase family 28 [Methylobacterium soli]
MRVLIAVTHLLGAGHLTRAAALARALARAGHGVTLVSGGLPVPLVRLDGVQTVQLPPVQVRGTAFGTLLGADGQPVGSETLAQRQTGLLDALAECAPDLVITELFPFGRRGLAPEFLALIEAARARRPRPLVVASIRDVLVAPDQPRKVQATHGRIAEFYDAVLVHGDAGLVPLDASWPVDAALRARLHYTGYIDEGAIVATASAPRAGIVVSGGSSAAGLGLYRAAAEAARLRPEWGWRILVGQRLPEADFAALSQGLPPGTVARARPDFRALLAGAAVSVSQAGYNTATDLLATGTRAVLVPFEAGRETEQRARAECLAARGLARVLPEADLSARTLIEAVSAERAAPPAGDHGIDLDGAARSVAILESLAADAVRVRRNLGPRPPSDPLLAALDAAAESGRTIPLWWRDDDAVAQNPGLDTLLALSEQHGLPILIAAIPALSEASLAERIARSPDHGLGVHGLSHANHAPPGVKPAEFGAHRPHAALVADAAEALRLARDRFGPSLLPVFVPPWNRFAPDLEDDLARLGYVGVSAADGAATAERARVDIHLDPVDWRGSRSLRDPDQLRARLARRITEHPGEPIGLLTHHRVHDAAIWAFLGDLLTRLVRHPAIRALGPRDLFGPGGWQGRRAARQTERQTERPVAGACA